MTNCFVQPVTKEFFIAWKKFRQAYDYTNEYYEYWWMHSPYRINPNTARITLTKTIVLSPLSDKLKAIALDVFLRQFPKKLLIELGRATLEDFREIHAAIRTQVSCYTKSEQEKRAFENYFSSYIDDPCSNPFLILYNPLDYDTVHTILSYQHVLNEDEESIIYLFLMGEVPDEDLKDSQRLLFINAVNKLKQVHHSPDIQCYKQLAEFYITLYPECSMSQLCDAFGLNKARFRLFCNRYIRRMDRRKTTKAFLDE